MKNEKKGKNKQWRREKRGRRGGGTKMKRNEARKNSKIQRLSFFCPLFFFLFSFILFPLPPRTRVWQTWVKNKQEPRKIGNAVINLSPPPNEPLWGGNPLHHVPRIVPGSLRKHISSDLTFPTKISLARPIFLPAVGFFKPPFLPLPSPVSRRYTCKQREECGD